MSMLVSSLKRRNEALSAECDTLSLAVDNLSAQIQEAYSLLRQYEPDYVDMKLGIAKPATPVMEPAE